METTLIIADDFSPAPSLLRQRARGSDFQTCEFQGAQYKGVGGKNQPVDMEARIGRLLGFPIKITLSFYRLGTPENEPTTYIHADRNCATWAGVLYLNEPEQCRGGTAFWRHKDSGRESLSELINSSAFTDFDQLNREGNDESFWEMTGLVGMKFNRLVVYKSDLFHSRYPKAGFGSSPKDGRLIWTCFFNPR
jgi:hypothetical protein